MKYLTYVVVPINVSAVMIEIYMYIFLIQYNDAKENGHDASFIHCLTFCLVIGITCKSGGEGFCSGRAVCMYGPL